MTGAMRPMDSLDPCGYPEVLATLLELVGREVELSVLASQQGARELVSLRGLLEAGPELGSDEDSLMPVAVGDGQLALKDAWIERAWRDPGGPALALLFSGGVLVEIEPVAEPS
jgi:hypothetical protein